MIQSGEDFTGCVLTINPSIKNQRIMMNTLRVVFRDSRLSAIQLEEIKQHFSDLLIHKIPLLSYGDKHPEISLLENTRPDIFTHELDQALIRGEADFAVHSARDLPYPLPEGLEVIALTERIYPQDALVSAHRKMLSELPQGARVGVGSVLRKEQLLQLRPDLRIVSIRGTVEQQTELVREGNLDAIVVALCALKRLELSYLVSEILPFETHPLQGSLALVAKANNAYLKSLFYKIDIRKGFGKVFLTGFGPGSADLITIQGLKAMKRAEIIFYDDLIDPAFLTNFSCKKVYVGKRKDRHSYDQDEINAMLYKSALKGKQVVRLKGGDPQIFGRGGEEFDYLRSRLINVEIIPGITSALAAASLTGIPLTQKEESDSVAFCAGYLEDQITMPVADTLVFYMAASNLSLIGRKVIESGKDPETPVALVSNISTPLQKTLFSTLSKLADEEIALPAPLIVIIGKTAHSRNYQPALGLQNKILVTGTNPGKYEYLGEIVHTPLIEIMPLRDYSSIFGQLPEKNDFDWVIFTSKHAVRYFLQAFSDNDMDIRWLTGSKIISIGAATSRELRANRLMSDLEAEKETSAGIIDLFIERNLAGSKVLLPCSEQKMDILPDYLENIGYKVTPLIVYRNERPEDPVFVDLNDIDIVVFTNPSSVKNFKTIYQKLPSHLQVIISGENTNRALYSTGLIEYNDWVI
jgi:uroporphyrinogen III methyltransferase / synthase